MENKPRFCTNCGTALVADARFCPGCGTACAVAAPVAEPVAAPVAEPVVEPVAEPAAEPVVEPVAAPVAEPVAAPVAQTVAAPAEPAAESVNIAMPIVAMACGIMSFILTCASLPEGGIWENFGFFLLASPAIALAIIFGLPNLKASIAARRINTIIFSAVGLGTAAFAATISLIDLLVHLS